MGLRLPSEFWSGCAYSKARAVAEGKNLFEVIFDWVSVLQGCWTRLRQLSIFGHFG